MVAKKKPAAPLKLDLGCGDNKREGFTGVDFVKTPSVDIVHDLFKFPWPFKNESVEEIHCSHFFEHVPARLRPKFMDECHRVLQPGGKITVIVPYYASMRAIQDFTHEWPPVSEGSFLYFNRGWREQNKLMHGPYKMQCDFDFGYGYTVDPEIQNRNVEYQQQAIRSNLNAVINLHVTLTRR